METWDICILISAVFLPLHRSFIQDDGCSFHKPKTRCFFSTRDVSPACNNSAPGIIF